MTTTPTTTPSATTPTPNAPFVLTPLSPHTAAALRAQGGEIHVADSSPGFPCRQCLRDAEVGEELLLLSLDPFAIDSTSPYRSASPIFIHRQDCAAAPMTEGLPDQLTIRQLSVRAFDRHEMMVDAAVIDGVDLEETIESMFSDDLVKMLHVHNASRGCYAVRVDRPA